MKQLDICKRAILFSLFLLGVVIGSDMKNPDVSSDGDVELFINFTSGSHIVNESPKVVSPIPDIIVISGQGDSLIATLPKVFYDHENKSALRFSSRNSDTSIVKLRFNKVDSSVTARFSSVNTGEAVIRITADDGLLRTTDTFSVVVKEKLSLVDTIPDLFVEKRSRDTVIVDLSDLCGEKNEDLLFNTTTNDSLLTIVDRFARRLILIPDTKELQSYVVTVNITAPDSQIVKEEFNLVVTERKESNINIGISIFSGYLYSGGGVQLLLKDRWGIDVNGYSYWDRDGLGGNVRLSYRFLPQSLVHPFLVIFGGYHQQTIEGKYPVGNRELALITGGAAAGVEARLGTGKRHGFSLEAGYFYGKGEYTVGSNTFFGSGDVEEEIETFSLSPLHLELRYIFYFKRAKPDFQE